MTKKELSDKIYELRHEENRLLERLEKLEDFLLLEYKVELNNLRERFFKRTEPIRKEREKYEKTFLELDSEFKIGEKILVEIVLDQYDKATLKLNDSSERYVWDIPAFVESVKTEHSSYDGVYYAYKLLKCKKDGTLAKVPLSSSNQGHWSGFPEELLKKYDSKKEYKPRKKKGVKKDFGKPYFIRSLF